MKIHVMKCKTCGSIIHPTIEQKHLMDKISRIYSKLYLTGLKTTFNELTFFDLISKCCKHPDYWYIKE